MRSPGEVGSLDEPRGGVDLVALPRAQGEHREMKEDSVSSIVKGPTPVTREGTPRRGLMEVLDACPRRRCRSSAGEGVKDA